MDVSTVVLKSFDEIWEKLTKRQLQQQHVMLLTAPVILTQIKILNNALIMVPHRFNPILIRYHRELVEYAEQPCQSIVELQNHRLFKRIAPLLKDPGLGI